MKFKHYLIKKSLVEHTLSPDEVAEVESWDQHSKVSPETRGKISTAMGSKGFITFPLGQTSTEIHPVVAAHLSQHGWDVKDYKKGLVTKKTQVGDPSRGIPLREKIVEKKLGKVLEETNATPDVKASSYPSCPSPLYIIPS